MTEQELFQRLKQELQLTITRHKLDTQTITLKSRGLSPEEAIGVTTRKDYPILTGKEIMVQAQFGNALGQAFTDAPADFSGTLSDILALDTDNDPQSRGLLIATLNAVLRSVGSIDHTVHCRNDEPEQCAAKYAAYVREHFDAPRIALVGYQPALLARLSAEFSIRVLDLNPQTIGTLQSGVLVENGIDNYKEVVRDWAELVLCTGSTLCNGSFINFLNIGKPVVFFGTSGAAAAHVLGAVRFCPMSV